MEIYTNKLQYVARRGRQPAKISPDFSARLFRVDLLSLLWRIPKIRASSSPDGNQLPVRLLIGSRNYTEMFVESVGGDVLSFVFVYVWNFF